MFITIQDNLQTYKMPFQSVSGVSAFIYSEKEELFAFKNDEFAIFSGSNFDLIQDFRPTRRLHARWPANLDAAYSIKNGDIYLFKGWYYFSFPSKHLVIKNLILI